MSQLLQHFRDFLLDLAGTDADAEVLESFRSRLDPIFEEGRTASKAIDRIGAVVGELYRFTRLNQAEENRVALIKSLDAAVSLILPNFQNKVVFSSEYADPLETWCRPAELSLAFFHLIVNACEAVEAVAERSGKAGSLTISTRLESDQALIVFQDTGCGMDEQIRTQIFDPFFTTKPVGTGTGLGLSTCHGIIEQHGGHIEVTSVEGQGSTFSVYLPMQDRWEKENVD